MAVMRRGVSYDTVPAALYELTGSHHQLVTLPDLCRHCARRMGPATREPVPVRLERVWQASAR